MKSTWDPANFRDIPAGSRAPDGTLYFRLTSHRQRIGRERTRLGLRPSPAVIEQRIDEELCAAAVATGGGIHHLARRSGAVHCHVRLPSGPGERPVQFVEFEIPYPDPAPAAPPSRTWEALGKGGPW